VGDHVPVGMALGQVDLKATSAMIVPGLARPWLMLCPAVQTMGTTQALALKMQHGCLAVLLILVRTRYSPCLRPKYRSPGC